MFILEANKLGRCHTRVARRDRLLGFSLVNAGGWTKQLVLNHPLSRASADPPKFAPCGQAGRSKFGRDPALKAPVVMPSTAQPDTILPAGPDARLKNFLPWPTGSSNT
jgi:hypothetical protein